MYLMLFSTIFILLVLVSVSIIRQRPFKGTTVSDVSKEKKNLQGHFHFH